MYKKFFHSLERYPDKKSLPLDVVMDNLSFNAAGLIPVITQDATSKQVLMFAWMNEASLQQTLRTQRMTYWSRSRQQLWVKGETSGHIQTMVSMAIDCDGDAILCLVNQSGAACHTGRTDCFYLDVDIDKSKVIVKGEASIL
jgi:phosphoribosyl-AMP cyclohydrolase